MKSIIVACDGSESPLRAVRCAATADREFVEQARESGCAGVVMGARDMGSIANLLIESAAARVVQPADVAAALVK